MEKAEQAKPRPLTVEEALEVARRHGIVVVAQPIAVETRVSGDGREATLYLPGGVKVHVVVDDEGSWAWLEERSCECVC